MGKLFVIGDSISQGFRSGGTAFTENAFSAYLAEAIGLKANNFRHLTWPSQKLKIDLEGFFRQCQNKYGLQVNPIEWFQIFFDASKYHQEAKEYYEQGEGALHKPHKNYSHLFTDNCAVEGMRIADAWEVTPKLCQRVIRAHASRSHNEDQDKPKMELGASDSFYRAAHRVLNPQDKRDLDDYSAMTWLQHTAETEGVDNAIVWLGANNALGTIIDLGTPKITEGKGGLEDLREPSDKSHKKKYNLWHPEDFKRDYTELIKKVTDAMKNNTASNWKVYVGTIPLVTIAPLLEGFGEPRVVKGKSIQQNHSNIEFRYYQYYKHYGVKESTAIRSKDEHMKFRDAKFIDGVISEYNQIIRDLIAEANARLNRKAFIVVDISKVLSEMAWKRNSGMPTYEYPKAIRWLSPPLNTKFYRTNKDGDITDGGLFSLDGIHPSVIGQGIIAHEFLKALKGNGSAPDQAEINWDRVKKDDTLWNDPLGILHDMVEVDQIIDFIKQAATVFRP